MSKTKFKTIYIKTTITIVVYSLISYLILIASLAHKNILISFLIPLIFGVLSSVIFLYLFSHQDFFRFIKNIEKIEKKGEKKYLKKFLHYGKILTCIIISLIGGPIFLALTVRFLFPKSQNKYQIIIIISIVSTILFITFIKGLLKIIL
jgi:hypothetical protein